MNPFYFSVLIPWSPTPTEWHPTEKTGPFSTLTRGSFPTELAARTWAREHLKKGHSYGVVKFDAVTGKKL